jgi:hypothetical protein
MSRNMQWFESYCVQNNQPILCEGVKISFIILLQLKNLHKLGATYKKEIKYYFLVHNAV